MGDQNKSIFVFLKIPLQPFNMLYVQIVGRLVKKKDIRFLKQQLSKKDLGSLTAGKLSYVTVHTDLIQPKSTADFLYFRVDHIKIMGH